VGLPLGIWGSRDASADYGAPPPRRTVQFRYGRIKRASLAKRQKSGMTFAVSSARGDELIHRMIAAAAWHVVNAIQTNSEIVAIFFFLQMFNLQSVALKRRRSSVLI
jgi:hypothetical protein